MSVLRRIARRNETRIPLPLPAADFDQVPEGDYPKFVSPAKMHRWRQNND
jgi:hypothetical protein